MNKYKHQLIEFLAKNLFFYLIPLFYKPKYKAISMMDLSQCHPETLGYNTYQLLEKQGLSIFEGYEEHDLKHCLLGIGMDVKGEVNMQYFELGNGNYSFSVLMVVIFGTLICPEHFNEFKKCYEKGKQSNKLNSIELNLNIKSNLTQLRQQLNINL